MVAADTATGNMIAADAVSQDGILRTLGFQDGEYTISGVIGFCHRIGRALFRCLNGFRSVVRQGRPPTPERGPGGRQKVSDLF